MCKMYYAMTDCFVAMNMFISDSDPYEMGEFSTYMEILWVQLGFIGGTIKDYVHERSEP